MIINPYMVVPGGTYSYSNPLGQGDRTATITVSGLSPSSGPISNAVNGSTANNSTTGGFSMPLGASSQVLHFDFGSGVNFDQFTIVWSSTASQGTWVLESSPDDSSWTTRKAAFGLGGSTNQVEDLDSTTTARYWRFRQTSGSTIGNRFLEITFRMFG